MSLLLKVAYARQTYLDVDLTFRFVSGRAICPDGLPRNLKRVSPEAGDLVYGQSVRAAVLVHGKTVTGSLILSPAMMDEPNAGPLEFTPDPTGKHANIFA